jgi:hypothetical protein
MPLRSAGTMYWAVSTTALVTLEAAGAIAGFARFTPGVDAFTAARPEDTVTAVFPLVFLLFFVGEESAMALEVCCINAKIIVVLRSANGLPHRQLQIERCCVGVIARMGYLSKDLCSFLLRQLTARPQPLTSPKESQQPRIHFLRRFLLHPVPRAGHKVH